MEILCKSSVAVGEGFFLFFVFGSIKLTFIFFFLFLVHMVWKGLS